MKTTFKAILTVAFALLVLPLTLLFWAMALVFDKDALITAFSQFMSLLPGKTGAYLRSGFYRFSMERFHPSAFIGFGTLFSQTETEIESGVYIGPQCNIGKCTIGQDTLLGSGVHVMSGKQQHNIDSVDKLIREQGGQFHKISIGKNCWIGNAALIMANVGDNTVVAAGSVVINDIESKVIAAGNPAKVIKQR